MYQPRLGGFVSACCALLLGGCSVGDLTLPPPPDSNVVITDFTPKQGYGGDLVRITGSGFGASVNGVEVLFAGGSARPESVASDGTSLTVRVPVGIDNGTLIVNAPGGRGTSKDSLTYLGTGHLQRPGSYTTTWVSAGLGNIAQIDGKLWIHASEMNQFVQPWPEHIRVRALIPEKLVSLSPKGDANGRLVFISETSLYAATPGELEEERAPELIASNFGPIPLSRVMVMANGTSAVLVQGLNLISVDLSAAAHKTQTVQMDEGAIMGMLESDTGHLILVRKKPDGNTAIEAREAGTLNVLKKSNSPAPLSGAIVTWQGPSNEWLGFADELGQVRYVNLDSIALDNRPTNLFVDEGASDLILSNDKTIIYSALPKHGRVTASSAATRTVLWSVQIGGEPTRLGINSAGQLIAVDPKQNRVTLIDPLTKAALGERQIGLGLGSTANPRWGVRVSGNTAFALARESLAIGAMDTGSFERSLGSILLRTPVGFAISSDASSSVIVHTDGSIGLSSLTRKVFQIEKILCDNGPLHCDPLTSQLVALEYLSNDRVLIVTTDSAQVRKLPTLTIESQKSAPAGTHFVGASYSTQAIGLAIATGSPIDELTFEEYAIADGFSRSPVRSVREKALTDDALTFLGLDFYRRSDLAATGTEATGLAFLFSHLIDPRGRTRIDALDRSDPQLPGSGFLGAYPTFSPDGRQLLGFGVGPAAGQVFISEGDVLSTSGIDIRAAIDFGATLTGAGFINGGERAFVVNGDADQIYMLE